MMIIVIMVMTGSKVMMIMVILVMTRSKVMMISDDDHSDIGNDKIKGDDDQ